MKFPPRDQNRDFAQRSMTKPSKKIDISHPGNFGIALASAVVLSAAIFMHTEQAAAQTESDESVQRLTQLQFDAFMAPYYSAPQLEIKPSDSTFVAVVKRLTSAAIDELRKNAVEVDENAALSIAELIQTGAMRLLDDGGTEAKTTSAESKVREFVSSVLSYGKHVKGPKSARMPSGANELIQVDRKSFQKAFFSFCPCYPFCW
jgi:hypothetical protein